MRKTTKTPRGKATPEATAPDEPRPPKAGKQRSEADEVHDAAHPGGLPDLEAKTDREAEHDTWWRHG